VHFSAIYSYSTIFLVSNSAQVSKRMLRIVKSNLVRFLNIQRASRGRDRWLDNVANSLPQQNSAEGGAEDRLHIVANKLASMAENYIVLYDRNARYSEISSLIKDLTTRLTEEHYDNVTSASSSDFNTLV
jgi:hypothetical protein